MQDFYLEYPTIDFILLAIFFITPFILVALKRKLFRNFGYSSLLKSLNKSLLIQIGLGILVFVISIILDAQYIGGPRSELNGIATEIGLLYPTVLLIFYTPCILTLNIVNMIAKSGS